jgi:hypothetical protein
VCRRRSVSMEVRWRERDWEPLREAVAEARPAVRASLAASGLLKFFECPLIRAQEYLLQFLIEMWSPEQHCFLVRGEQVAFTAVEDIYFLTGLPFRGIPLSAVPALPRDTDLAEVAERYCSGGHYMTGSSVRISAIDVLLHRCVAAMIVRVYGTRAPHRISGSELLLMERVVVGRERFAWGLMLHAQMVAQLDRCRSTGRGEFAFGSILVAFFLERVPALRPRVVLEVPAVREPRLRWWSEILVRHGGGEGGHYFTEEAAQIWRQTPQFILWFPYAGVDFRGDPDMILPPGEVFDHRGMLCIFVIYVCDFDISVHMFDV